MKDQSNNNVSDKNDSTFSYGIAMGIGVIGAFVAMKDKIDDFAG